MFMVENQFFYGMNINGIGKRAYTLNHSRGRFVFGAFDKNLHEGSICTGHKAVISYILHKSIFLYFVHNGTRFYDIYI